MKNFTLNFASFILGFGLTISMGQAQSFLRSFDLEEGQRLKASLQVGADIKLLGWDEQNVQVKVVSDESVSDFDIRFIEDGQGLVVEAEYKEAQSQDRGEVIFIIHVPRRFDAELETMGGDIMVAQLMGVIEVKTLGGDLDLNHLDGQLAASTMGGDILLRNSQVDGKASTMGGDVVLRNVTGDIDARSMGGEVIREGNIGSSIRAEGPGVQISRMGGDINLRQMPTGGDISTMGGDIRVENCGGDLKAETKGGDIQLGIVKGNLEVLTYAGDVMVKEVYGQTQIKTYAGDIKVGQGANAPADLQTKAGNVRLILAESDNLDIDIEVAYEEKDKGRYRIESDLPLSMTDTGERKRIGAKRYNIMRARGKTGDGTHPVVIRTVKGNVILELSE